MIAVVVWAVTIGLLVASGVLLVGVFRLLEDARRHLANARRIHDEAQAHLDDAKRLLGDVEAIR